MRYTVILTLAAAAATAAPLSAPINNAASKLAPSEALDRRDPAAQNAANLFEEMKAGWERMSKHREDYLTHHNLNQGAKRDVAEAVDDDDDLDADDYEYDDDLYGSEESA